MTYIPKKGKKGEKDHLKALYLMVETLNDLMRSAVSQHQTRILAFKSEKGYRLLSEGEKIEGVRIFHGFDLQKIGKYIIYQFDYQKGEHTEIINDLSDRDEHFKSYKLPIVELSKNPYIECKKADLGEIHSIEASDYLSIIRFLVNESNSEESHGQKVYSYISNGKQFIASLELFWEHGKVLTSAKLNSKERFAAIVYDYNTDTAELSKSVTESSKPFVRIINLAGKLPIFTEN